MGGVPNALGPSPTLGPFGPSHQWHHKSQVSLRDPPCADGVVGTPQGEVRDNTGSEGIPSLLSNSQDINNQNGVVALDHDTRVQGVLEVTLISLV